MKFLTPLRTKQKTKKEEQKYNRNFIMMISKTPEKLAVTNYHKLLLLPLVVRPWWIFDKQKSV